MKLVAGSGSRFKTFYCQVASTMKLEIRVPVMLKDNKAVF